MGRCILIVIALGGFVTKAAVGSCLDFCVKFGTVHNQVGDVVPVSSVRPYCAANMNCPPSASILRCEAQGMTCTHHWSLDFTVHGLRPRPPFGRLLETSSSGDVLWLLPDRYLSYVHNGTALAAMRTERDYSCASTFNEEKRGPPSPSECSREHVVARVTTSLQHIMNMLSDTFMDLVHCIPPQTSRENNPNIDPK